MADTKISDATNIDAVAGGDELPIADASDAGAVRSCTADQLKTYIAPAAATQAEQETGTDLTTFVSPGRQHFHPSAAKFWVIWTGNSTTILASYNVTSIADTGVGDADITIATDFSSADWVAFVTGNETAGFTTAIIYSSGVNAKAAGTLGCNFGNMQDGGTAAGGVVDPDQWCAGGFGDQ